MTNGSSFMTTFVLDRRPRLTRTSNLKSRTGCITCRRRHNKCDEGKPACAACLKYQGYCEGYAIKEKKKDKKRTPPEIPANRPICPKPAKNWVDDDLLLEPNYASLVFSDQLEKDHFDCWIAFTRASVLFRSDLLTQIVPQISWKDAAIKHAALAIGAATLGSNTREQRILRKGMFYPTALRHYGKALGLLCSSPMSPERTLLVCLLFITFESLCGDRAAGLNHINHGFRILEQHHPQGDEPSPLLGEIINNFHHLGLQAWAHNGLHPQETHAQVPWCCRGRRERYAVKEIPVVFENLEMARCWWNIVRHHIEHHAPFYTGFQIKGSSPMASRKPQKQYVSSDSARHIRGFVRYLDQWSIAFLPLAIKAEPRQGTKTADFLKALSLRIHYLYLWTGVRSVGWTDREETKRMIPIFHDIVAFSRQLLAAQEARQSSASYREVFTLEDSPTWPLACVYRVCAVPELQREVIQLFREYPRRDSLLDTHTFLIMMEWIDQTAFGGVITSEEGPAEDCVVIFHEDTVVLQKHLWDPQTSRWKRKGVRFHYL